MKNISWRTVEPIGFLLAFILALVVRTVNIGMLPLTLFEAGWAVPALEAASGSAPLLGSQPAYTALTTLFFFTLGDSNLTARLAGVLVGASLVWVPFVLRRQLGPVAALLIAFGLALDPFLVAYSRLAGGPMLAVGFTVWTLVAWYQRASAATGILAGLALLSGPAFFQGALSLLGALLVVRVLPANQDPILSPQQNERRLDRQLLFIALVITVLLGWTIFTLLPQGLGALANTLPDFLQSWWQSSGVPALRLILALVIYQPLAVLFAAVRSLRSRSRMDALDRFFLAWLLVALLLVVVRVGRQPLDLVWALLPLWGLAGREISYQLQRSPDSWVVTAGEAILIFILMLVGWLNLAAIVYSGDARRWLLLPLLLLVGVVATVLVGLGWSRKDVRQGLLWGLILAVGLFVVGETLAVIRPRTPQAYELWQVQSLPGSTQAFEQTLGDLSEWSTGRRDSLDVQVINGDVSLAWSLRRFPAASFSADGIPTGLPGAVISDQQAEEPQLAGEYRGQSFDWELSPDFQSVLPPDWLRWLVFRQAPLATRQVSLWARADVFPGGVLFSAAPETPTDEDAVEPLIPDRP
jgi:hypothetical protein